ncbi:MAG: hypothetical protein JW795_10240, partial [Chitinivibrionales bacterium]|nr:hypothetical protein [Chitinivibrionales bacterium]
VPTLQNTILEAFEQQLNSAKRTGEDEKNRSFNHLISAINQQTHEITKYHNTVHTEIDVVKLEAGVEVHSSLEEVQQIFQVVTDRAADIFLMAKEIIPQYMINSSLGRRKTIELVKAEVTEENLSQSLKKLYSAMRSELATIYTHSKQLETECVA